jgi:hypothetical protein
MHIDRTGPTYVIDRHEDMVPLTADQEAGFSAAARFLYCNKLLGDDRVRDHSHVTGLYRGAAHMSCNLEAGKVERSQSFERVPVIFHNLKGYDCHFGDAGSGMHQG